METGIIPNYTAETMVVHIDDMPSAVHVPLLNPCSSMITTYLPAFKNGNWGHLTPPLINPGMPTFVEICDVEVSRASQKKRESWHVWDSVTVVTFKYIDPNSEGPTNGYIDQNDSGLIAGYIDPS